MLTIFALPKAFRGHFGVIQRNAIAQWGRLRPKPEILIFGDEEGTTEIAQEFGVRHIRSVERNQHGTPLLSDLFEKAQRLATYDTLCYVNADILLLGDFMGAVRQVANRRNAFLMVGVRRDVELEQAHVYESAEREEQLKAVVFQQNRPITPWALDYFVFRRGLYSDIPPFAIGRLAWDNWLLWRARQSKAALIDASPVVLAVHQNHNYSHHAAGYKGIWEGDEAKQNRAMAIGRVYTIEEATHILTPKGIKFTFRQFKNPLKRAIQPRWFLLLRVTSPVRHRLGLRRKNILRIVHSFLPSLQRSSTIR
jgi:hypothetical protein